MPKNDNRRILLLQLLLGAAAVLSVAHAQEEEDFNDYSKFCDVTIPDGGKTPFCTNIVDDSKNNFRPGSVMLGVGESCTPNCGGDAVTESFNLVGDCSSGGDVPATDQPDSCESACPSGSECSERAELRTSECVNGITRNHWGNKLVRSCSEKKTAGLGKSLVPNFEKLTCTPNGEGNPALLQPGGNQGFVCDTKSLAPCNGTSVAVVTILAGITFVAAFSRFI